MLNFKNISREKWIYSVTIIVLFIFTVIALNLNIQKTKAIAENKQKIVQQKLIEKKKDLSDFSNTLFIGNSISEGLMMYSAPEGASFYVSRGLNVDTVTKIPCAETENGTVTVLEAMKTKQYNRIYIMFGINELAWPYPEIFKQEYKNFINDVKALEPNADIYIQSILPVNTELLSDDKKENFSNEKINQYNILIKSICDEISVNYLDVHSIMVDENGQLFFDATTDGIHLTKPYCDKWLAFIKGEK